MFEIKDEEQKKSTLVLPKTSSMPLLESPDKSASKLPMIENKSTYLKSHDRHSSSTGRMERNILTIKGKTYKRKEILAIKAYFDSIDVKNKGYITIEDYIKSASKSTHLKRIAVSLYNYLDSK